MNSKSSHTIEVDKDTSIYEGIYIGMLGSDSVLINSEPSDGDWRVNPIIYLNRKVIYKEKNGNKEFLISQSQTKTILLKNNIDGYILITMVDPPFVDKWFILRVHNKKVEKTGSAIKEVFNDIDNDGYYEIGGRELTDAVCLDCDSILYQPYKIFKLGNELEFDSILSKNLTIKLYGTYLGPIYKDTVLQQKENIDWNNTNLSIGK